VDRALSRTHATQSREAETQSSKASSAPAPVPSFALSALVEKVLTKT
jgi:hypothetical protein